MAADRRREDFSNTRPYRIAPRAPRALLGESGPPRQCGRYSSGRSVQVEQERTSFGLRVTPAKEPALNFKPQFPSVAVDRPEATPSMTITLTQFDQKHYRELIKARAGTNLRGGGAQKTNIWG